MKSGFRLPEVVKNPVSFYLAFPPSSAFGTSMHSSLSIPSLLSPTHHFHLHHWTNKRNQQGRPEGRQLNIGEGVSNTKEKRENR